MESLALIFSFRERVDRRAYVSVGVALAVLKLALDFAVVWLASGVRWSLVAYLTPLATLRTEILNEAPEWVPWAMVAYALPFAWVGLTMSVRRSADAGFSPWWGTAFAVPFLNYILIAVLCFAPSRGGWAPDTPSPVVPLRLRNALLSVVVGTALSLGMLFISVQVLREYGTSLFIGTPLVVGFVAGYLANHEGRASLRQTLATAWLAILVSGGVMLLFGAEGILCLAMAFVPAIVMASAGAVVGRAIAGTGFRGRPPGMAAVLLFALPLTAGFEAIRDDVPVREVITTVEIDASPGEVWEHVVRFVELDPPADWVFKTGVAYPVRARLDGEGVGAVRHCEFSTGAFVEPITRWEPGRRLSFDVRSQPPPMKEWSPYADVHPPHLDGYFRSIRGEFRLVELPGARTRLEGSTWYELDIGPFAYWSLLADQIVHRIHLRVLNHVKSRSESAALR